MSKLTDSQKSALKWFKNRGGDGMFDKTNCLIARGERAGVMRGTWSVLEKAGLVERYQNNKRVRITEQGKAVDLSMVYFESECA
jgi:hypothetical protein